MLADPATRRQAMIGLIAAAAIMVLVGGTVGFDWLRARLWLFAAYWLLCAFLTLTATLLAAYDALRWTQHDRRGRRELRRRFLEEPGPEE